MSIELGLDGDDVRFLDGELCCVFDDHNPVIVRAGIGEDVYKCGLASAGSTGYQDISATDGFLKFSRQLF